MATVLQGIWFGQESQNMFGKQIRFNIGFSELLHIGLKDIFFMLWKIQKCY